METQCESIVSQQVCRILCLELGSCNYEASMRWARKMEVAAEFDFKLNFDEAIDALEPNEILLLPHLSEAAARLTMREDIFLWDEAAAWFDNPPLYLAAKGASNGFENMRCASIDTLRPLAGSHHSMEWIRAQNTQDASRLVVSGHADCCITNETGVRKGKLTVIRQLKHMRVFWLPFLRN